MKKFTILSTLVVLISSLSLNAQEEESSPFNLGADLYSNYIWRGSKFGTGPAIQPCLEYSAGNLTIGSWGSFGVTDDEAAETDLYLSYGFDFGLSVGVTDYYYPGNPYFDYADTSASHAFEVNLGYEIKSFSLSANYVLNEATSGPESVGGDMYFELGYSFENFEIFVGGGDGWNTSTHNFGVCNVGVTSSKDIKVSDTFVIPLTASVILNPEKEQFFIVVGLSF